MLNNQPPPLCRGPAAGGWKGPLGAVLLLALLALLYTFPLVLKFDREIPGHGGDLAQYYWCHWWFHQAAAQASNPWFTDYQWYPNGTSLVFSTNRFASAAAGSLLTPLIGLTASYNFTILLSFFVSGLGVYLFVRELTGSGAGAIAAAVVFAFNPYKLNKLIFHHIYLSTHTFGFALWMLARILKGGKRRRRDAVFLGALIGVTAYESIFYFDMLALALSATVLWFAVFRFKDFWKREVLLPLATAAGVFLLVFAPMAAMIAVSLPEYGSLPYAGGAGEYSNDLLALLLPSPIPFTQFGAGTGDLFTPRNHVYHTPEENFGSVGWIALALAAAGWWLWRKSEPLAGAAAFGALLFAVLSLGPVLQVAGRTSVEGLPLLPASGLAMPYSLLRLLPPVGLVRAPSRFIILSFLFIAPLVGLAVARLAVKPRRAATAFSVVLAALLILDYFPKGIETSDPAAAPSPVRRLAAEEGDYAVLPFNVGYREHMRWAPVHGKPMTAGYTSRTTLFSRPIQDFSVILLDSLQRFAAQHPDSDRLPAMRESTGAIINAWGIGYILHRGSTADALRLSALLGGRIAERESDVSLIILPRPGSGSARHSLDVTARDLPPMPAAGLQGGAWAEAFYTGWLGVDLCIPDALMPDGRIAVEAASAVESLPPRELELFLYVNRVEIGRWRLGEKTAGVEFRLPGGLRRLPVNLVTIRTSQAIESGRAAEIPFSLEAVSGEPGAACLAALRLGRADLMTPRYRGSAIHVAVFRPGEVEAARVQSYDAREGGAGEAAAVVDTLGAGEWAVLFTSGSMDIENAEQLAAALEKYGLGDKARRLKSSSFVALIEGGARRGWFFRRERGLLNLLVNAGAEPLGPVAEIKSISFR